MLAKNLDDLPPVLTVPEAARLLRLKRSTAYELVRTGQVPSVRFGRQVRVPTGKLLEMLGYAKKE